MSSPAAISSPRSMQDPPPAAGGSGRRELRAGYRAAELICRRHAKSFYFASFFLPKRKRRRAYAVYAFCRLLDDAVDEATSPAQVERNLSTMEQALADVYAGKVPATRTPEEAAAMRAFADTVRVCAIPQGHFADLVHGCRMDQTTRRYETWQDLEQYCYHVAGVVGLIMCRVFELTDPAAEPRAVAMGNAMQLTNILRDVREDWERGRLYLPREDLARFGLEEGDIGRGEVDHRWRTLAQFEIERARRLFYDGADGLAALDRDGSRQTAAVMATVYGGILGAIERADYDVFSARRHLTLGQKLLRVPAALRLARRRPGQPVPRVV